jgi:plasmid stabilization system protein ParE
VDAYLDRLQSFCANLAVDPDIGHRRDDLLPGVMTRTFEKRRVICFPVLDEDVRVLAIYGAQQDWESRMRDDRPHVS